MAGAHGGGGGPTGGPRPVVPANSALRVLAAGWAGVPAVAKTLGVGGTLLFYRDGDDIINPSDSVINPDW